MLNKSHLTAIVRKTLPTPTKWLRSHSPSLMYSDNDFKIRDIHVLDYGCGKCSSLNPPTWDNYDPHFKPDGIPNGKKYDVIICNYVLCVLPPLEQWSVLRKIKRLLKPTGIAYITVRNDKPKQGWGMSSRGTYQTNATSLPIAIYHKNSRFMIYLLTKKTPIK